MVFFFWPLPLVIFLCILAVAVASALGSSIFFSANLSWVKAVCNFYSIGTGLFIAYALSTGKRELLHVSFYEAVGEAFVLVGVLLLIHGLMSSRFIKEKE